jgi:hypothetical protein
MDEKTRLTKKESRTINRDVGNRSGVNWHTSQEPMQHLEPKVFAGGAVLLEEHIPKEVREEAERLGADPAEFYERLKRRGEIGHRK